MQFERKHYIYIILAILLSLIAIDGTGTIINYNNYTNGSSNGSFYTDISMNENNITEVTEMRNNGTLYTPYINLGSSKIELGTKFLGSPLRMFDLQITGMNAYYNLNMNNKSLLNCLNCANKTELNEKVNKSGDNITGYLNNSQNNISTSSLIVAPNGVPRFWDSNTALELERDVVGMRTVATTSFFGANAVGSNISYPSALGSGTTIFNFFGAGYDGTAFSGSQGYIRIQTNSAWNTTSHGTKITFAGTKEGNLASTIYMTLDNGTTFNTLSGTGYEFACLDANGKLLRSSVSCDLI